MFLLIVSNSLNAPGDIYLVRGFSLIQWFIVSCHSKSSVFGFEGGDKEAIFSASVLQTIDPRNMKKVA
jgi:hypothetical protein